LNTASAYKPPRRLGSKPKADKERQRPHPLEAIGDSVIPLIISVNHGMNDSDTDLLTESPAKVDICREISSKGNRTNFRGICDADGLENAPWDTTEDFGSQQGLHVLRHEEQSDES
jgi:hypothetical protein